MVDRRHLEDTLLAQFVGSHLQNHGERLNHEHASDERQQKFLFNHYRNRADGAAESERTYVAHEHFRRMGVVPKKTDCRAYHGATKNSQLADLRHAFQLKIGSECSMAADVSEHG